MSDGVMVAVIGFFSLVVSCMTALVGYFKVWKPSQKNRQIPANNGERRTVEGWIASLEARCSSLEKLCRELQKKVDECEHERSVLIKDRFDLLVENRELRNNP